MARVRAVPCESPEAKLGATLKTLITAAEIEIRIEELATRISEDYHGQSVMIVGILTGCVVFLADLIRRIRLPVRIGLIEASSYRGATTTSGELQTDLRGLPEIHDQHILLIDDIFDTGKTLDRLLDQLRNRGPKSLRSCVLLWKESRREVAAAPDYFGFKIPNEFVVGYGLDYDGEYRHLPDIAVLEPIDQVSTVRPVTHV